LRTIDAMRLGLCGVLCACTGAVGEPGGTIPPAVTETPDGTPVAAVELRRLTVREYMGSVRYLLGSVDPMAELVLPRDPRTPFDNDSSTQTASQPLIEGTELLATEAADALLADTARRDDVIGCTPSGPTDAECMRSFVRTFGRRAIRRPVPDDDVERYTMEALTIAMEADDFYVGAMIALRAFLQHPRFLYRVEIGTPVPDAPGVRRLDGYEVATRLSFLIVGATPDDALLDAAAAGELDTPEGLTAIASDLLSDPRALDQAVRVHSMWLGHESLPHDPMLTGEMKNETAALLDHVLFRERRPWQDIFRSEGTYVTDALATHYGLPAPGSSEPTFVSYPDDRRGILSHGTFLALGANGNDTSPIHRGLEVRRRLLCQHIELPVGFMPEPIEDTGEVGNCKEDQLAAHRTGGCAGCHALMDGLGFGLEAWDPAGRFRTVEPNHPECAIDGVGRVEELDAEFSGPGQLSTLLVDSGLMVECFESQIYRYAIGRAALDEVDGEILDALAAALGSTEFRYDELVTAIVSSPSFFYRREVP
jgi:hypothetical protein